ncbi:MAG: YitT family protein [Eubacteriales bacterium]
MNIKLDNIWRSLRRLPLRDYALCFAGSLLVSLGVYFFKFPNSFSTGGVSGISVILSGYFHISSASNIMFAVNMLLLIIGFIFVGRDCGVKTVIGTFTLSGALLLWEKVIPLTAPLTDTPLLELVYAVGLPAVGSAILFNAGGSTGGTDIIALILKKHTGLNVGSALMCSDVVITLGAFLFGIRTGLLSCVGLVLKSLVVDTVIESINMCKCFTIITNNPAEISHFITETLGRSSTVVEARGAYTLENKEVMITVMKRSQAVRLRHFLHENYPDTFMIITNSSEILGKGFRGL